MLEVERKSDNFAGAVGGDTASYLKNVQQVQGYRSKFVEAMELRPGIKILDVGCGSGITLSMIQQMEPQAVVFGVDNDFSILGKAGNALDSRLINGSAYDLPIQDMSMDLVIFERALQWMSYWKALEEAYNVLAFGGRIVAVEVDWPAMLIEHKDHKFTEEVMRLTFMPVWEPTAARSMPGWLEDAGFCKIRQKYAVDTLPADQASRLFRFDKMVEKAIRWGATQEREGSMWLDGLTEDNDVFVPITITRGEKLDPAVASD